MPISEAMDSFADNLIKLSSVTNWLATFKNTTFNVSTRNIDCGDKQTDIAKGCTNPVRI